MKSIILLLYLYYEKNILMYMNKIEKLKIISMNRECNLITTHNHTHNQIDYPFNLNDESISLEDIQNIVDYSYNIIQNIISYYGE